MKLSENRNDFNDLTAVTASWRGIPESAVRRDYFIVMMLQKLEQSEYAEHCVFKGGTSLSKGYPGSIERFSEDIDLTYITDEEMSDKQYSRMLKKIETVMSEGAELNKIPSERNDRNKSAYVTWPKYDDSRIKLEIGSNVRPDPYEKKTLKTYIQEYLESINNLAVIEEYELKPVTINTLNIERTFLDKVMAVKRHALCGNLGNKVRHIYDVARLYEMPQIRTFLDDGEELKKLLRLTKETDDFYLKKRSLADGYNPNGGFDFETWKQYLDKNVQKRYEELHKELLYTNEKQNFSKAIQTFEALNRMFLEIGE